MFGRFLEVTGVARFLRFLREGTLAERAAALTTLFVVLLGIFFRTRSLTSAPLWLDEATWAVQLMEEPLTHLLIRPIGFMAIVRTLARVLHPTEGVLRFLPWLAGVGVTVLAVPLGRRLFRSEAARLLFVALLALDPAAIDLAKEFKPYSVCLFFHALLVFLALRYSETRKASDLAWTLVACVVAVLFAQDAVFAYPGVFLLVGIEAIRERRFKHLVGIVVAGLITVAIIGALYVFVWSKLNHDTEETYWGKKYNVFFVKGGTETQWILSRYADMVELPAFRWERWESKRLQPHTLEELGAVYGAVFLLLNVLGLGAVLRGKKWKEGLLLVLPLLVMAAFNVKGFWPFGPFRANLFTAMYIAALAGCAIDREPRRTRLFELLPVGLVVLLPLFVFEKDWHKTKLWYAGQSTFPAVLEELVHLSPDAPRNTEKEMLLTDDFNCALYKYYTKYQPTVSREYAPTLDKRFRFVCAHELARMLKDSRGHLQSPRDRAWFIVSMPRVVDSLKKSWPRDLHRSVSVKVGEGRRSIHYVYAVQTGEVPNEPPP